MSKSFKIILAVLALGLVLCSYFVQSSGARRLYLTLGFNTWVGYGPFYVADKKGFLAAEGLQVEFQRIEGTAERRQALIAGRLDALGTTIDDVAVGAEQGVPAKVVLAVDRQHYLPGDALLSAHSDVVDGCSQGIETACDKSLSLFGRALNSLKLNLKTLRRKKTFLVGNVERTIAHPCLKPQREVKTPRTRGRNSCREPTPMQESSRAPQE